MVEHRLLLIYVLDRVLHMFKGDIYLQLASASGFWIDKSMDISVWYDQNIAGGLKNWFLPFLSGNLNGIDRKVNQQSTHRCI